jgi:hypothetical protein
MTQADAAASDANPLSILLVLLALAVTLGFYGAVLFWLVREPPAGRPSPNGEPPAERHESRA